MIIKIGVKTLEAQLVAYRELAPSDDEAEAFANLNAEVYESGVKPKDPTMIIYYDPKGVKECRREIMISIKGESPRLKAKTLPPIRAGFIVFAGTKQPLEYYYDELRRYIEARGLTPITKDFCSIEAVYQPDQYDMSTGSFIDEDAQENWTTEILLPIEG